MTAYCRQANCDYFWKLRSRTEQGTGIWQFPAYSARRLRVFRKDLPAKLKRPRSTQNKKRDRKKIEQETAYRESKETNSNSLIIQTLSSGALIRMLLVIVANASNASHNCLIKRPCLCPFIRHLAMWFVQWNTDEIPKDLSYYFPHNLTWEFIFTTTSFLKGCLSDNFDEKA